MQRNDVRFSEEFGTPYYGSEIEEDAPDKLERKIKTLESNLRDLNTLYFKSLDNYNSMDEWWHKEWHQSQGIPCANDEYCPLTRRVNLPAVPSTPSAPVAEAAPPVNLRAITSHLIAIAADIARRKYVSNLEGVRTIKQAQMIIANDSDAHGRLAYDLKEIADELHKLDAAPPATKPAPAPILAELERISASIDCDAPCSQNMQALLQHLIDFIVAGKETK